MLIIGGKKVFYGYNLYKSLNGVYGLNFSTINMIVSYIGLSKTTKLNSINNFGNFQYKPKLYKFFSVVEKNLESLLRKRKLKSIQELIKMNSYKGLRHKLGLPVRGQRTHTNSNTIRYLKSKKKVKRRYKKKNNA